MSARHRKARVVLPEDAPDLGPGIRLHDVRDSAGQVIREATAVRASWSDPDDLSPLKRAARQINGARAADPLRSMLLRGGLILAEHIVAADRLGMDAELAGGAAPGRGNPWERLAAAAVASGGVSPSERALAATARVRGAMQAIGDERSRAVVAHVVGLADREHRDVASWARTAGLAPAVATGMLVAALDRLTDYYSRK